MGKRNHRKKRASKGNARSSKPAAAAPTKPMPSTKSGAILASATAVALSAGSGAPDALSARAIAANTTTAEASERSARTNAEPSTLVTTAAMAPSTPRANTTTDLPKAAQIVAFTEAEEAFFAAGESQPHLEALDAEQAELEASHGTRSSSRRARRPSFWQRLFKRVA